jgi:hypothetical protein
MFMTKSKLTLGSALVSLGLFASQAAAIVVVDETVPGLSFNRPLSSLTDLSGTGTDVPYDSFGFSVTADGSYRFRSFALPLSEPWDNFLILYEGSFDPSSPLTNAVIANDDLRDDIANIGKSGFDFDLMTGVPYVLVTTGFDNDSFGRYLNVINGPGQVTAPVPEAETYAMMLAGLALVGFLARRRRV